MTKTDLSIVTSFFMSIAVLHASDNTVPSLISSLLSTQFPFAFLNSEERIEEASRELAQNIFNRSIMPTLLNEKSNVTYGESVAIAMAHVGAANAYQKSENYQAHCFLLLAAITRLPLIHRRMPLVYGLGVAGMMLKWDASQRLPHTDPMLVGLYLKGAEQEAMQLCQVVKEAKLSEKSNQQPPDNV